MIRERLLDLDRIAYERNLLKASGFLSLAEQEEYHRLEREFRSRHFLTGGYESAERKRAVFLPDYLSGEEAAAEVLRIIRIAPLNEKFSTHPDHRDYLGAIMNLGIERDTVGDIILKEPEAFVFCSQTASAVLLPELRRVGRTSVVCSEAAPGIEQLRPSFEEMKVNAPSERVDAVTAQVFRLSRNAAEGLCDTDRVSVDGRLISSGSRKLNAGETVSVRGVGKFIYDGPCGTSRKGRLFVQIRKYV